MTAKCCIHCGSRLALVVIDGRERKQCPSCGAVAYRNPAPVALAVIEHDAKLLLIRRALNPLMGYWAPPGGYVECGESLTEAAIREVREEASIEIRIDRLIGAYSQSDVDVIIVGYQAHSLGGEPRAGDDATELALFEQGHLPLESVPRDGTPIDRWFGNVIRELTAAWR